MCILYMAVVLNSFICKRPFFANKKIAFANLSRTPRLSFARVSYYSVSLNPSPKKKLLSLTQKKIAGFHGEPWRPWQLKPLHRPLERLPHTHILYIYIYTLNCIIFFTKQSYNQCRIFAHAIAGSCSRDLVNTADNPRKPVCNAS